MPRETQGTEADKQETVVSTPAPKASSDPEVAQKPPAQGTTIGVEYGNPYDPDSPPWPVYRDPTHDVILAHQEEDERLAALKKNAKGTEYRFTGHEAPREGTVTLITTNGVVDKGDTIKLSDDEAEKIRSLGFILDEV